jgi:hypothetical protein
MSTTTVTRGLSELNTIKKRLSKLTAGTTFLSVKVGGRAWRDHLHETKSNWQAINDLLTRYEVLKFAIITSNATTLVKIGDRSYTVAEAIAMKEVLQQKKSLLDKMRQSRQSIDYTVEQHGQTIRGKLDRLLELNFKREQKTDESDIKTISDAYLKNNAITVVDPLGLDQEISRLDEEIDSFTKEVDFALSESNAVTRLVLNRDQEVLVD